MMQHLHLYVIACARLDSVSSGPKKSASGLMFFFIAQHWARVIELYNVHLNYTCLLV